MSVLVMQGYDLDDSDTEFNDQRDRYYGAQARVVPHGLRGPTLDVGMNLQQMLVDSYDLRCSGGKKTPESTSTGSKSRNS